MKKRFIFAACLSAICFAQAQPGFDPATQHQVLRVPRQERTKVVSDVVYTGERTEPEKTEPQKMDVYIPADAKPTDRLPVAIFLSGTDKAKHWVWFKDLGQVLASQGIVAVMPDKRYQRGQTPQATEDIRAVLKFLKESGSKYQADGTRVCLWAFSGGGVLLNVGMRGDTPTLRCLVNYYGVLDTAPFTQGNNAASEYNPIELLKKASGKLPPMLIVRAGKDREALNNGIDAYVSEALRRNQPIELINYPEGQHGFDALDNTETTKNIVRRSIAFVKENTSASP